jgi:hypothetical protein
LKRSFQRVAAGLVLAGSLLILPAAQITHAASGTGHTRGHYGGFMSLSSIAKVEGVTPTLLQQDLAKGQTLLQIAKANHSKYATSAQALATELLAPFKTRMQQAVTAHYMTQAQETQRYNTMLKRWTALVTTPHPQLFGYAGTTRPQQAPKA